jgi:hypothetical protein
MTGYFDPYRVDEHDIADPRGFEQRYLCGEPAADGISDDRDLAQVELVDHVVVELGKCADTSQGRGSVGASEAGMYWYKRINAVGG